ncbi:MAG: hypothetical protein ABI402_15705 [Ferruginibacter sp.]
MKLHFHELNGFYGQYAKREVAKILAERNITELQLEESFHHAGEKTSKFLLFIIIPAVAFASWLLGYKKRKFYFDHFIFSTEMSSLFLMWGFLIFPMLLRLTQMVFPHFQMSEDQIGLIIYIPLSIYIAVAARRFFSFKRWYSILYAVLFFISLILFLEIIYKFILFVIAIRMA